MTRAGAALLVSLLLGAPVAAAPTVIYRCVAADGAVTLQNGKACAKGSRSQKRVIAAPLAAPVQLVAPAAPIVPPTNVAPAAPVEPMPAVIAAPEARLPPPALQACVTADAQRYYSDSDAGTRCAPLNAVGLDGRTATDAQACEVVQDRCSPVPEGERCAAWAERRRVAEQALLFAPEKVDSAREELARVEAATAGTACAR